MERVMDALDVSDLIEKGILEKLLLNIHNKAIKININGDGACLTCGLDVEPIIFKGNITVPRWCSDGCRLAWAWDND
jgi:hypothetical protein